MIAELFSAPEVSSILIPGIPRLLTALTEWAAVYTVSRLMEHRFSRAVSAGLAALMLLLQIFLRCGYRGQMSGLVFSLSMGINAGFMLLCLAVLSKAQWRDLLFAWLLSFLDAEFAASFLWQMACLLRPHPSLLDARELALLLLGIALLNLGLALFLHRQDTGIRGEEGSDVLLACGVTVLVFLAGNVNVLRGALWRDGADPELRHLIGWIRTLSDICGLILLWLLLRLSRERRLRREIGRMEAVMDLQYQQYLAFRDSNAFLRRQCHDFKHQIAALRESGGLDAEIREMENTILQYETAADTGNKILDVLLTQKLRQCCGLGIRLDYNVRGEALSHLETRDICTLFGNLLDNAVEAVQGLPPERRVILLEVLPQGGFLQIRTENPCGRVPVFRDGMPDTAKPDRARHGIGTQSIRYTAERYGGSVQFQVQDGWFVAAMLLPMPSGKEKPGAVKKG